MKSFILLLSVFLILSCSNKIGGIKSDIPVSEILKSTEKEIEEFKNRPKLEEKVTFRITHENINLKDYDITIQGMSEKYYYYYYGPYQKLITVYLPHSYKNKCIELTFSILDKKKDLMYYYTSNLCYYILEAKKDIKVKLLGEYQKYKGLEINYKLTGCPNDL